jgi:hypothetical protein
MIYVAQFDSTGSVVYDDWYQVGEVIARYPNRRIHVRVVNHRIRVYIAA